MSMSGSDLSSNRADRRTHLHAGSGKGRSIHRAEPQVCGASYIKGWGKLGVRWMNPRMITIPRGFYLPLSSRQGVCTFRSFDEVENPRLSRIE